MSPSSSFEKASVPAIMPAASGSMNPVSGAEIMESDFSYSPKKRSVYENETAGSTSAAARTTPTAKIRIGEVISAEIPHKYLAARNSEAVAIPASRSNGFTASPMLLYTKSAVHKSETAKKHIFAADGAAAINALAG